MVSSFPSDDGPANGFVSECIPRIEWICNAARTVISALWYELDWSSKRTATMIARTCGVAVLIKLLIKDAVGLSVDFLLVRCAQFTLAFHLGRARLRVLSVIGIRHRVFALLWKPEFLFWFSVLFFGCKFCHICLSRICRQVRVQPRIDWPFLVGFTLFIHRSGEMSKQLEKTWHRRLRRQGSMSVISATRGVRPSRKR
jgi:hypothetical protein